jgi:hypothetical protein
VTAIFVAIMLSPKFGAVPIFIAVSILFFGLYNWLFEKGYSEFSTPAEGAH